MKISFLDCPHANVQQFTECCLDCGYNVYTTELQYLDNLKKQLDPENSPLRKEIRELEARLGIKK